jgi:hypothetical protein
MSRAPSHWDEFKTWVRKDALTVHIVVHNSERTGRGVREARLDGRWVDRARVELVGEGELKVWLGAPEPSRDN